MEGIDAVVHAATLHKPHVVTHTRQAFLDTNINGTLTLLEESVPAAWIHEGVKPASKNIYGITKLRAEQLCESFHRAHQVACVILRTSRFFPEADDDRATREGYSDANAKANEMLYRRADIADVVDAHLCALAHGESIGFGRYVVSATSPFTAADLPRLNTDAAAIVRHHFPEFDRVYAEHGWTMFPRIDRVYVNSLARAQLQWHPTYDFSTVLDSLAAGRDPRSGLAVTIGSKSYHSMTFADGPYPVEGAGNG